MKRAKERNSDQSIINDYKFLGRNILMATLLSIVYGMSTYP